MPLNKTVFTIPLQNILKKAMIQRAGFGMITPSEAMLTSSLSLFSQNRGAPEQNGTPEQNAPGFGPLSFRRGVVPGGAFLSLKQGWNCGIL